MPDIKKLAENVAERAHQMPRGSALLFKNKAPRDERASHYRGLLKLEDGTSYWVGLWVRRIDREPVLEVRLVRKT
jgi:hypothetical protein